MSMPQSLPRDMHGGGSQTRGQHVLAVPQDTPRELIENLARWRFPRAEITEDQGIQVSRYSRLSLPVTADPAQLTQLRVPLDCPALYTAHVTVERGDIPWPHHLEIGDPVSLIFAAGQPVRDEERMVQWLIDAARHVGGALLLDGQPYRPDPEAGLGIDVVSDTWLDPLAAQALLRTVIPGASIDPVAEPEEGEEPSEVYTVSAQMGSDGLIVTQIGPETDLPPIVTDFAPAGFATEAGAIVYRVRWYPPDPDEIELESGFEGGDWFGMEHLDGQVLDPAVRIARSRSVRTVHRAARVLWSASGGLPVTPTGFPADRLQ